MNAAPLVPGQRVRVSGALEVEGAERAGAVGEVAHASGSDVLVRLPLYDADHRLAGYAEAAVRAGRVRPLDDAAVRLPRLKRGERAPEIASEARRRRRRR